MSNKKVILKYTLYLPQIKLNNFKAFPKNIKSDKTPVTKYVMY